MDDVSKRRVGRPKANPPSGPLVLGGGRARVKLEVEVSEETADELKEYAHWVELSSAVETKMAMFTTVDFALRDVFRRDRIWQERRKSGARGEASTAPQPMPTAPTPPSLPPPSASSRPVPAVPTTAAVQR
jgi:hypothetical protein